MSADYKSYLATAIISDQRTITYRLLARQLRCHNNAAKRMLYDFYKRENAKKKGSVHAIYLLSGVRKPPETAFTGTTQNETNGEMDIDRDVPPSSPPMSSSMPAASQEQNGYVEEVPVFNITLVREEELEEVKQSYQSISSIHIYSLEPASLQDLNVLTSCGQELFDQFFVKEDPMVYNSKYGVIQNKSVRRRTNRRPPPAPSATTQPLPSKAAPKSTTASTQSSKSQPNTKSELKRSESQESQSHPSSKGKTDTKAAPSTKSSTLKRDTSDLFKSFAKGSQKPKTEAKQSPSGSSAASPTASREDTPMKDAPSSDEEGSEDPNLFAATSNANTKTKRPSDTHRQEREAKLRKMMDDGDPGGSGSPLPDSTSKRKANPSHSRTPSAAASDASAADWSASDREDTTAVPTKPTPTLQEEVQGPPKRRRGRRQVMKKKTSKDADGYLVTSEEPVWESFSEDEPTPKTQTQKAKPKPTTLKREDSGGLKKEKEKGGKAAPVGKKGGGNIMNFFAKK